VSLRRDTHSAFDEIAPSMAGLSERVVQTVLTENSSRQRRKRLMFRMRGPLSLVAVFALIAMVAAVLIGGRMIHDSNLFHNSAPAGDSHQSQVAQLEAVPLHLPVFASQLDCKSGPFNSAGSLGSGPVYGNAGLLSPSTWGDYYSVVAYADTAVAGPILVRARDLFTGQQVVFVGQYAAGPVVGSDTFEGHSYDQHVEVLLNTSNSDKQAVVSHRFVWKFIDGVPSISSGATGWQIDGIGFSEVFVSC
jgi:hypothetical protein